MKNKYHKKTAGKQPGKVTGISDSFRKFKWPLLTLCLILTFLSYTGSPDNDFTNWDDTNYIIENPGIRSLSSENIRKTFAYGNFVMGNYHPLTMLSYCVDYRLSVKPYKNNPAQETELKAKVFLTHNLVLHLLNTALVFFFIQLLAGRTLVSFITCLLFGIHTMHVESVAWVAERKDLLYTLFYLASMILYLLYVKKEKRKAFYYSFSILLFLLSLLSKAMAVSLVPVLFALDYFLGRKISVKTLVEKLLFIVPAIVFGIIAINAQQSAEAIDLKSFSLFERVLFSGYGVMAYIGKLIAPVNLSCFYDYPVKQDGTYPFIYYLAPLLAAGLAFLVFLLSKKSKTIPFGFLFFFFSIALVLQLLPVGGAIISDRYTYIPYIGLFFIGGVFADDVISGKNEKLRSLKVFILPLLAILSIALVIHTRKRVEVWKDSITLWNNAIEQYGNVPKMYNGRGDAYNKIKQYELAVKDLDNALRLKPDYPDAFYNRGLAKYFLGKHEESILDYTMAIQFKPALSRAYYNRAGSYFTLQRYKEALEDTKKAQKLGYPVEEAFFRVLENAVKTGRPGF